MPRYSYQAQDRAGKLQQGVMDQPSLDAAVGDLRARNWLVLDLAVVADQPFQSGRSLSWYLPIRAIDIEVSLRQISVMLRSGMPLLDTAQMVVENAERKHLHYIWSDVAQDILGGASMSEAMQAHSVFPAVAVYLARVGEQSGELATTLERASEVIRRRRQLRSRILSALAYPLVVFVVALFVAGFMVFSVIPKIQTFLRSLGRELPPMTKGLIDVTTFLNTNIQAIGIGVALAIAAIVGLLLWPPSRYWFDRLALKVPIFGPVWRIGVSATLARNLQTLLISGVSLLDALRSVENLISNRHLAKQLAQARERVIEGESLADAIRANADFTPMLPRIIAIGEASGRLDDVLDEAAVYYEEQLQRTIARLAALVEPAMLLIVGGIVGYVYISFFMALFAAAG